MRQLAALLLVACGLSVCMGSLLDSCSVEDAKTVKKQWNKAVSLGSDSQIKLTGGRAIFTALFARAPGATALYKRVNVDDFEGPLFSGHIMRVMSGLDMLVNYLDNRPTLEKLLSHLADQHAVYAGVTSGAFDLLGEIILNGLPVIIDNFDSFAWNNCLVPVMKSMAAGVP